MASKHRTVLVIVYGDNMLGSSEIELEIVEKYELLGEKRYRLRIRGTSIYLNIAANNEEEAINKANKMIRELSLDKLVREIFR